MIYLEFLKIISGTGMDKKKNWCATKVKKDGTYDTSSWGWCGNSCPKKAPTIIPTSDGMYYYKTANRFSKLENSIGSVPYFHVYVV